jgi:hypothetical protein
VILGALPVCKIAIDVAVEFVVVAFEGWDQVVNFADVVSFRVGLVALLARLKDFCQFGFHFLQFNSKHN